MDWKSFIGGIEFGGLDPADAGIYLLPETARNTAQSIADWKITRLPVDNEQMKNRFSQLCKIPRMSTFAIGALISEIVSEMAPQHQFVNVGTWHGFTLLSGMIDHPDKRCVGVDNFSEFGGPRESFYANFNKYKSDNHHFYEMDYKVYFQTCHEGVIGFYIYDGVHTRESQCEGLLVAEPFLTEGSLILVDDINHPGPAEGTIDFTRRCTGRYEVVFEQHTAHNMHPTFWNGVVLLRKVK